MHMNDKKLWSMWRDLSATPPARILRVILEAVLQTGTNKAIGSGNLDIWVDKGRKRRGEDLLKPERVKGGRV